MKYRNIYILLAALSLFSCTKEKERDILPAEGQMRFAVTVEGSTKASMTGDDLTQFYLKVNGPDAAFSFFDSIVKDKQGNWKASSKQLVWKGKDEESAITYAAASYGALGADYLNTPFTDDLFTSGTVLPVLADQSTQERLNAADLLTMKESESLAFEKTKDGVIPITLKHGLSKVNFVLTLDGEFYDKEIGLETNPLTDVVVSGAKRSFSFEPMTGEVSVPDTVQTGKVVPFAGSYEPGKAEDKAAKATYECVLVPQELAAGALKLNFSIGTANFKWTNAKELELAQGKEYTILVSVKYQEPAPAPTPVTPTGALSGKFTINAAGDQVYFAKGNLTVSNNKFAFLENSWTYNTAAETDNKVNKDNGSQHFNWSVVFNDASSGESTVVDGINTDLGAGWRGLSLAEWRYLLGYDGKNSGVQTPKRTVQWHYYAKIKGADIGTGDKRYLLIFPDAFKESDWTSAMGTKPTTAFDGTSEQSIAYTADNFTAMQNAGIVILPAAGYRGSSSWSYVGNYGYYWSSTSRSASASIAYYLYFLSSNVRMSDDEKSYNYFSVRLVCDASAAGDSGPIKALDPFTSGGNPLQ